MNSAPKISIGDPVTLHYRLSCNGQEIVNTFTGEPETFCLGQYEIDPRLEVLLIGLQAGDHRTFDLDPGAAFGSHDANLIHNLPRSDFGADLELISGHEVEFTLPNGQTLAGTVLNVAADRVEVDFNHPLADLPIMFEVKILGTSTHHHAD